MKYPALYIYKSTPDNGQELKYSIRSLKNIKNWNGEIFISGDKPDWLKNVTHIKTRKRGSTPLHDAEEKWRAALADSRLPETFIAMNDDFYATSKTDVYPMNFGELSSPVNSFFGRAKNKTSEYLKRMGVKEPLDYSLHVPMIMTKTNRQKVSNIIYSTLRTTPLLARSIYGNLFYEDSTYYEDKKTKTKELKQGVFISTQFYTPELDELLPEPSEFEVLKPTVHMIWIGSPLPGKYRRNILTYERMGYTVKLWTTPPVLKNRNLYNAMTTWAGKADVMRLEILYKYGGLYTDIDSRMLRKLPIDSDLVCVKSPNGHIANETIYAEKGHPAIKEAIDRMKDSFDSLCAKQKECNLWDIAGATYITPIFRKYNPIELPRSVVGKRGERASTIIHSYDASWNSGRKSDKKPIKHWVDVSKL